MTRVKTPALRQKLDDCLRASVEKREVPLAVAAIAGPHETLYCGACDGTEPAERRALGAESVFYVASMAKPLTTAAVLKLAEEGRLSLDDPLSNWLPGASGLKVLEGYDGQRRPVLRPPARAVTLRDLITHSAGFAHRVWSRELLRYETQAGLPPASPGGRPAVDAAPLLFDPGARWEYSGTAVDLLGQVVEEITATSIGVHLRSAIFEPLGMCSTGWDLTPAMTGRRVGARRRRLDGGFDPMDGPTPAAPARQYGAGGLYSTAGDYLAFLRMLLADGTLDGRRVLASATVEAMAASRYHGPTVGCLRSTDAKNACDVEFFPGQRKSWGLGFLINEDAAPSGRQAGSFGWFGALNTFFWADRSSGLAGVFLSQFRPCADEGAMSAFSSFEAAAYSCLA